jgi:hypothetical protein
MKKSLILRCLGQRDGDQWVIVCLDFDLAAQAETFERARDLLENQIKCYVRDAMVGQDREHADYLLFRRAPMALWFKYYAALARDFLSPKIKLRGRARPFREAWPLVPAC